MAILSTEPRGKLTYEHLVLFPEDGNQHEIINGRHYMNASPIPRHQTVSRLIQFQLMGQIEVAGHGQVFNAPINVQFDDFNVVEPDLVIVMNINRIVTETKIKGVPNLVVEILSPSTRKRDQTLKKELYEHYGVPEFWIVDADEQSVKRYQLGDDQQYGVAAEHRGEISIKLGQVAATVDLTRVW